MKVVIGLGGNALLRRHEVLSLQAQRGNVAIAGEALATVAARHDLIITHGNGPQVGLLALQAAESDRKASLDILGAETDGMIGYLLEQELMNRMPGREIATLLTHVEVDSTDPAFKKPTKPIGAVYDQARADELASTRGWVMAPDGDGYRRVVPSPEPRAICQLRTIRRLARAGVLLICAGGGGIPVVRGAGGRLRGADAVIDKDRTSGLLAACLEADMLVLLTDVEGVYRDFGGPDQRLLTSVTPDEMDSLGAPAGSMGPKAAAAAAFVRRTGRPASIGSLDQALEVVEGKAGTRILPASEGR
ncbi:MAG: carbamate kinase [Gemmatimonadetes bacterium]|nr:carbamate kinase [Gemmatimonadota bacterium]